MSDYQPISHPTEVSFPPEVTGSAPDSPPRVALWRWWVATILIGIDPLVLSILGASRHRENDTMLPRTVLGLLIFAAIELAVFGVVWGIAWLFARASKDDLFLRWKNGWKTIGWGVIYSLMMRFSLVFLAVFVFAILAMLGFDVKKMMEVLQKNGQGARNTFEPVMVQGGLLYRFLMVTLVSFVVAGLREELWRCFTMAGMLKILPRHWNVPARYSFVLITSSIFFGLGHVYQGATGVLGGALLGLVLGGITLYHRSIWPAVIAHGCFDALSFILLLAIQK